MRISKAALLLTTILLFVCFTAVAAPKGMDQEHNVNFYSAVKVGDTILPAGDYKVEHLMEGENHIMLFTSANKKTTARVACKLVELPKKSQDSSKIYVQENGQKVLKSLTFKGDNYRHEF